MKALCNVNFIETNGWLICWMGDTNSQILGKLSSTDRGLNLVLIWNAFIKKKKKKKKKKSMRGSRGGDGGSGPPPPGI